MKQKIVIIALLAMVFSVGITTTANAHPGWHRGYFVPRVRVVLPAPVVVDGYYGGGYYNGYNRGYYREAPKYQAYCRPHYDRDRYYGRDWDHDRGYHRGWRR